MVDVTNGVKPCFSLAVSQCACCFVTDVIPFGVHTLTTLVTGCV